MEERYSDTIQNLKKMAALLPAWFDANARVLPWRSHPAPYWVWVSEIMLQQTRVEAVKPYFLRFVDALPDVRALAQCEEERLLKLWEGLGYYNRVHNMQLAAQTVVEKYGGELPADYGKLLELKGIGSYTAGAIASIAFQIPVPAVDGNVLRVLSRFTADETDIAKLSAKKAAELTLQEVMPKDRPGAFNQALMELGAMVCVPNGPAKCGECPLKELCQAKRQGRVEEFPKKAPKKPRRIEERTVLLICDGDRVALRKRPKRGLLAGLYEFPNERGSLSSNEVLALLKRRGFSPLRIRRLSKARHIFSHVEWHMTGYMIAVEEPAEPLAGYIFAECADTRERYPIPSAFAAYREYLKEC